MLAATQSRVSPSTAPAARATSRYDALVWTAIVLTTVVLAVQLLAQYAENSRLRWDGIDCDRNFHYAAGLKMGLALRHLDLIDFATEFSRLRTWPPLHALFVSIAIAVFGPNHVVAVLPSLVGWVGATIAAFSLARKLCPSGGNAAGATAAILLLASPAHRAFATDCMLESLGACLSMTALCLFVDWKNTPDTVRTRRLAICLTLLFFEKYNYWLLIVLALLGTEYFPLTVRLLAKCRSRLHTDATKCWLKRQFRHPLNYIVLGLLIATVTSAAIGGTSIDFGGGTLRVDAKAYNLWHLTYLAILVRVAACWRSEGFLIWANSSTNAKRFFTWGIAPIAVWCALPKRLGYVVWYLSPFNGPNSEGDLSGGLSFFWHAAVADYHFALWVAVLAVCFAVIAIFKFRILRPGAGAICCFVLLAAMLTVTHANRKSRFLHSWIGGIWVLSGVGIATFSTWPPRFGRLGCHAASLAAAAIAFAHFPALGQPGRSPESGHAPQTSSLDLADGYLPWLDVARQPAIFATLPAHSFLEWTYLERFPDRATPQVHLPKFAASSVENQRRFNNWLAATGTDRIVLVDIENASRFYFPDFDHYRQFRELLASQTTLQRSSSRRLDGLGCVISLWERVPVALPNTVESASASHVR